MNFISDLAKQGLGYFLFAGSLLFIFFLLKEIRASYDKRVTDLDEYKAVFLTTAKDLLTSNQNLQQSINGIVTILQNVKFKK